MGIFGALTTAVSGLRAQSYALENISGNIANSQTTAFKRTDTNFTDLIPDAVVSRQVAGSVLASSRPTNNLQGDIQASGSTTHIAFNGSGYFVVAQPTASADGQPIFGGTDMYTRRGDFEINKDGYLVNGAGYFLKLLPIDRATGNVSGSVAQVLPLATDILPARQTNVIQYRGNLPLFPMTDNATADTQGSEIMRGGDFTSGHDPRTPATALMNATTSGSALALPGDLVGGSGITEDGTLTLRVGSGAISTFTFGTSGAPEINTLQGLADAINNDANLAGIRASIAGGQLTIAALDQNKTFTVGGTSATELGLAAGPVSATANPGATGQVIANDEETFLKSSVPGESLTIYDRQGTPVNVQIRWAKVNSAATGGQDSWNMFYLTNSSATGTQAKWTNAGQDFTFVDSQLTPAFANTTISNLTVNGVSVGDVTINHGTTGLTQYAADTGQPRIITLSQDGYPAGEVLRLSIGDGGVVTAFYSNGQMADIAKIPTVYFNADNQLKRLDGGAFAATFESGQPIPGAPGQIVGGALEGSNTDIADEFTKLIVTQQAYSANTRIVSTSNEMLQEALNMVR